MIWIWALETGVGVSIVAYYPPPLNSWPAKRLSTGMWWFLVLDYVLCAFMAYCVYFPLFPFFSSYYYLHGYLIFAFFSLWNGHACNILPSIWFFFTPCLVPYNILGCLVKPCPLLLSFWLYCLFYFLCSYPLSFFFWFFPFPPFLCLILYGVIDEWLDFLTSKSQYVIIWITCCWFLFWLENGFYMSLHTQLTVRMKSQFIRYHVYFHKGLCFQLGFTGLEKR